MRFTHISEISDIYGRPPALILGGNKMYKEHNLSFLLLYSFHIFNLHLEKGFLIPFMNKRVRGS